MTKNSVLPLQTTLASEKYSYLLTSLEFDDDVYVNDPFICSGQDEDCEVTNCKACDWSGESACLPIDFYFYFFFFLFFFFFLLLFLIAF